MSENSCRRTSMYKPLPPEVTVKNSRINGLGLFTIEPIEKEYVFGITHVQNNNFQHGYIRTPLGGFINHSTLPNCDIEKIGDLHALRTKFDIAANSELTVCYTFTNPKFRLKSTNISDR